MSTKEHRLSREARRISYVFSRLLADMEVAPEQIRRLPEKSRGLADQMLAATPEQRQEMWKTHVESLPGDEQAALDALICKADPLADQDPDSVATFADVSKVLAEIRWLWRNWIPRGFITLVAAMAGVGKSFLMLALAKIILERTAWPDDRGNAKDDDGDCILWIDTEASQAILVERIREMHLDLASFILPTADPLRDMMLDREEDLACIREAAFIHRPALLVIDSLRTAHGQDEGDSKMSLIVKSLATIARDLNIPIVLVHHLRKGDGDSYKPVDLDRVRGSTAIVALARAVIVIEELEEDAAWKRLRVIKNNLAPKPPPLGMRIDDGKVEFGPPPEVPGKKTGSVVEKAREFLLRELASGPGRSADLIRRGAHESISRSSIYRAAEILDLVQKPDSTWSLPPSKGQLEFGDEGGQET